MANEKNIETAATLHALMSGFDQFDIPNSARDALVRYVFDGIEPGGFMRAVLENDLAKAATQADSTNVLKLREYAMLLLSSMPIHCWGSPEKVEHWMDTGGLKRHG